MQHDDDGRRRKSTRVAGNAALDDGNEEEWLQKDEFTEERVSKLKGNISLVIARLETAPAELSDLTNIQHEGLVYVSRKGKPEWKRMRCQLGGDQMALRKTKKVPQAPQMDGYAPVSEGDISFQFEICYAHMTINREDKLTEIITTDGAVGTKKRLVVITFGEVVTIGFANEDDADAWWSVLKKLLRSKFTRAELRQKEEARQAMEPLLIEQECLLWARHEAIVNALAHSGFWHEKEKKLHEGFLYILRGKKKAKKVYTVLFRDYIYLFKPHERVSANARPTDMVALKFVQNLNFKNGQTKVFVITTPLRTFTLKGKHEIAVENWLLAINKQLEKKFEISASIAAKPNDDLGYTYQKPLIGKISIMETTDGRGRTYKLKKSMTSWTFGRSSSADVRLASDNFISRQHFKITLENNVPYVIDLGQSRDGTLLNGKKVTKRALRPNDVIRAGDTSLTFMIKDPSIFVATRTNESSENSEDLSFSSSEDTKPKKKKEKSASSSSSSPATQPAPAPSIYAPSPEIAPSSKKSSSSGKKSSDKKSGSGDKKSSSDKKKTSSTKKSSKPQSDHVLLEDS